jgi:uncharacterized metal-binding protein YceD (DUF177 family)
MTDRIRLADAGLRLDSIPATGREVTLSPSEDERQAIAADLHVTSVDRLDVRLSAVKFRGGIRVTGRLEAEITQPSVLSLEPIRQTVSEPIDRVYLPGQEKAYAGPAGAEVFVDLEGDDMPDHFEGGEADLSDLVLETLALSIDLYPRGPGEIAEDLIAPSDEVAGESPFAALKSLKDKDD